MDLFLAGCAFSNINSWYLINFIISNAKWWWIFFGYVDRTILYSSYRLRLLFLRRKSIRWFNTLITKFILGRNTLFDRREYCSFWSRLGRGRLHDSQLIQLSYSAAASWRSLHLSSYSTIDWFPLLRPASSVSGGVGNLIYEWRFW
jgi:hypothetical protein